MVRAVGGRCRSAGRWGGVEIAGEHTHAPVRDRPAGQAGRQADVCVCVCVRFVSGSRPPFMPPAHQTHVAGLRGVCVWARAYRTCVTRHTSRVTRHASRVTHVRYARAPPFPPSPHPPSSSSCAGSHPRPHHFRCHRRRRRRQPAQQRKRAHDDNDDGCGSIDFVIADFRDFVRSLARSLARIGGGVGYFAPPPRLRHAFAAAGLIRPPSPCLPATCASRHHRRAATSEHGCYSVSPKCVASDCGSVC